MKAEEFVFKSAVAGLLREFVERIKNERLKMKDYPLSPLRRATSPKPTSY